MLLGIVQILLSLGSAVVSIYKISMAAESNELAKIIAGSLQLVFVSLSLLVVGIIVFTNGWRLDPLLQFGYLLLTLAICYLIVIDLVMIIISQTAKN